MADHDRRSLHATQTDNPIDNIHCDPAFAKSASRRPRSPPPAHCPSSLRLPFGDDPPVGGVARRSFGEADADRMPADTTPMRQQHRPRHSSVMLGHIRTSHGCEWMWRVRGGE